MTINILYGSEGFNIEYDYVIKGLIPDRSLIVAFGPSGSYKSFLAVSLACHIATGQPWAGNNVTQGSVLYVAGEGSVGVSRRIKAWEDTFNFGNPVTNLARTEQPIYPSLDHQVEEIVQCCNDIESNTGEPVGLVILDTLARCFGSADENSTRDMNTFIKGCGDIINMAKTSILIIHHTGKNKDNGARGSSALRAAADVEIAVDKYSENSVSSRITKMKDAEPLASQIFDLEPVFIQTDTDGDAMTSLVVVPESRPPAITDQMQTGKNLSQNHKAVLTTISELSTVGIPTTRSDISQSLSEAGYDTKHLSRWLDKLSKDGTICCEKEQYFINQ